MKMITLTQGKVALVDDEDYDWLSEYKWCAHKDKGGYWYALRNEYYPNKKRHKVIRMHRQILNAPKGIEVDHRDHQTLNNQRSNIRLCTRQQNNQNRIFKKGTSKYKGVNWHKHAKLWSVEIWVNNKKIHLGYYKRQDETEAAKAYDRKAKELFGEFAWLNIF